MTVEFPDLPDRKLEAPERGRRWSYSQRTLFVVVTLAGCWLGYQFNWIRKR